MTTKNETLRSLNYNSLGKHALYGAGITFVLAAIFLSIILSVGDLLNGESFWKAAWLLVPLGTGVIGGTLGGSFYYLIVKWLNLTEWKKIMAIIISIMVYILLVWLSLIAGLSVIGLWD